MACTFQSCPTPRSKCNVGEPNKFLENLSSVQLFSRGDDYSMRKDSLHEKKGREPFQLSTLNERKQCLQAVRRCVGQKNTQLAIPKFYYLSPPEAGGVALPSSLWYEVQVKWQPTITPNVQLQKKIKGILIVLRNIFNSSLPFPTWRGLQSVC